MARKSKIQGGYVIIPKNTLRCNKWKELTSSAKATYIAMLTEFIRDKKINPEHKVKITQNQIRDITGMSRATIWRGIKQLKEKKFLHVEMDEQGGLERNYTTYTLDGRYLY